MPDGHGICRPSATITAVFPGLAPSATQNLYWPGVRREMTKYEISRMIEGHVLATRTLREAGYDGIQLHVSHGSIVGQMLPTES